MIEVLPQANGVPTSKSKKHSHKTSNMSHTKACPNYLPQEGQS